MKHFIIFLFPIFLFAQPKPVKPIVSNDPQAEKALKALQTKLNGLKSYKLTYKMSLTDADNKAQNMSGSYLGAAEKSIIEIEDNKTVNDGKTQWSINTKEKEIQITKVKTAKSNKIETPVDIIKRYDKLFKYRVKEAQEGDILTIELIPLNKNSNYFKIDLSINLKKNQLTYAKLYDRGGARINFAISKTEENLVITPILFTINTSSYKGYEVLDMR